MALVADSLIEYPCDFPIKVMGRAQPGFSEAIFEVVATHAPDFDEASMTIKTSKAGNYVSATCVIRATSRAQLDAVYQALCEHPMVVMVL
jgi:uncharacterized protein